MVLRTLRVPFNMEAILMVIFTVIIVDASVREKPIQILRTLATAGLIREYQLEDRQSGYERFWVADGCASSGTSHEGSVKYKSYEAGVRCCSENDETICTTPLPCLNNEMSYDDAVLQCPDGKRLCSRDELIDGICCGTGGKCDSYEIWTSTEAAGLCDPDPCNLNEATGEVCDAGICNCGDAPCDVGQICNARVCAATETCEDGIQNQDETDIDCGGVCSACAWSEESPDKYCRNNIGNSEYYDQLECQELCEADSGCVGIARKPRTSSWCFLCQDDILIDSSSNNGFYRNPSELPDLCDPYPCKWGTGEVCDAGICKCGKGPCKDGQECNAGVCETANLYDPCDPDPCNADGATDEVCYAGICNCGNAPCDDGQICNAGVCVTCNVDGDCATGEVCLNGGTTTSACVEDPCDPDPCNLNEATGEVCNAGICNCGETPCDVGQVCSAGVCATCNVDGDCATGEVCRDGGTTTSGCVTYFLKPLNTLCTDSEIIDTVVECQAAVDDLYMTFASVNIARVGNVQAQTTSDWPKGCYIWNGYQYLNHNSGMANSNARPICKD